MIIIIIILVLILIKFMAITRSPQANKAPLFTCLVVPAYFLSGAF